MLEPISPKALAVLMNQTFAIWPLPENWQQIAPVYREALEAIPLDLVQSALKHVRLTSKWFPKPSELIDPVRAEMENRKQTLRRLTTMDMLARKQGQQAAPAARPKRTEAEIAAASAAAAQAKAILDNATIKRVPTKAGDHRTPTADPYRAAYAALKRTGDE